MKCVLANLCSVPLNFTITPSPINVTLFWERPASDGTSPIQNYTIYRGMSNTTLTAYKVVGNVTSFVDANITIGTAYYYKVAAINAAGIGNFSEIKMGRAADTPDAPTILSIDRYHNNTITIRWNAPGWNGGSSIIHYRIYRSTMAGLPGDVIYTSPDGTTRAFTDGPSALNLSTTYFYSVTAINAKGEGQPSIQWNVTTYAIIDSDEDGMPDEWETAYGLNPLSAADQLLDLDLDGLINVMECIHGTNPGVKDTDADGLNDGPEVLLYMTSPVLNDTDDDGMLDGWEVQFGLDPNADDSHLDPDADGLNNLAEFMLGTNPLNQDSDGDGYSDYIESIQGTDPLDPRVSPVTLWDQFLVFLPLLLTITIAFVSIFAVRKAIKIVYFKKRQFPAYMGTKPYIFVSYARKDIERVYPVMELLSGLGYRIWYDKGLKPTNEIHEEIAQRIKACTVFLVFISEKSMKTGGYVQDEIYSARDNNREILPVLIEETVVPGGIQMRINQFQAIKKFQDKADLVAQIEQVESIQECKEPGPEKALDTGLLDD